MKIIMVTYEAFQPPDHFHWLTRQCVNRSSHNARKYVSNYRPPKNKKQTYAQVTFLENKLRCFVFSLTLFIMPEILTCTNSSDETNNKLQCILNNTACQTPLNNLLNDNDGLTK